MSAIVKQEVQHINGEDYLLTTFGAPAGAPGDTICRVAQRISKQTVQLPYPNETQPRTYRVMD